MAWSLHMDKTAIEGMLHAPDGAVLSSLRDILARHAVELVPDHVPGANKGLAFNLHATDGHELPDAEQSAIIDELMLADTAGYISGATGTPQPRMS